MIRPRNLLHALTLSFFLPCLFSLVVYYGFCTNYTCALFHEEGFRAQYENNVYRYRVTGRVLLLLTDQLLRADNSLLAKALQYLPDCPQGIRCRLDPYADNTFYKAYVAMNTLFFVLSSLALYLLFFRGNVTLPLFRERTTVQVLTLLLIAFTQFVVVPYDMLAYFLYLLAALVMTRPATGLRTALLVGLIVAATLTRESSILIIAHYVAIFRFELAGGVKRYRPELGLLVQAYVVTYLLLRLFLGFDHALYLSVEFFPNMLSAFRLAGLLLFGVVTYALLVSSRGRAASRVFLLAATPYLVAVLLVARTWEIRLWGPVWLGLIVLGNTVKGTAADLSAETTRKTTSPD